MKAETSRTVKGFGLLFRRLLFRKRAFKSTGSTFSKVLGVQPLEERRDVGLAMGLGVSLGTSSELFLDLAAFPWPSTPSS